MSSILEICAFILYIYFKTIVIIVLKPGCDRFELVIRSVVQLNRLKPARLGKNQWKPVTRPVFRVKPVL